MSDDKTLINGTPVWHVTGGPKMSVVMKLPVSIIPEIDSYSCQWFIKDVLKQGSFGRNELLTEQPTPDS